MDNQAVVVLCTFGNPDAASAAAHDLVGNGLAACVNLLPEVRSIYLWNGRISDSAECLVMIKTTAERFEALRARLVELHTYDVPEVIALPVVAGHAPYLAWVAENSTGTPAEG
jgi:periplasmic divalent cation tolerance protein